MTKIPRHRKIKVYERDGWRCSYCDARLTITLEPMPDGSGLFRTPEGFKYATVDHVIPRSRGGGHGIENLVACCLNCNCRKAKRTPEEWLRQ